MSQNELNGMHKKAYIVKLINVKLLPQLHIKVNRCTQAFTKLGQTQQDNGYVAETNVQTAYPLPQQLYVQRKRPVQRWHRTFSGINTINYIQNTSAKHGQIDATNLPFYQTDGWRLEKLIYVRRLNKHDSW